MQDRDGGHGCGALSFDVSVPRQVKLAHPGFCATANLFVGFNGCLRRCHNFDPSHKRRHRRLENDILQKTGLTDFLVSLFDAAD
jgi:hypothetical protein